MTAYLSAISTVHNGDKFQCIVAFVDNVAAIYRYPEIVAN